MNYSTKFVQFLILICLINSCSNQSAPEQPQKFLPDILSTSAVEYGITFSPSGDSCFFVRHNGQWGKRNNPPSSIYLTTSKNGQWSEPTLASFSNEETDDGDVFISPDGSSLFFTSNRDYPDKKGKGADIWKIDKNNGQWGSPYPLDSLINSPNTEYSPVTNKRGDLYFAAIRKEGIGQGDIYVAKIQSNGEYSSPELIENVSTEHGEWNVFVEPENKWLILESSGRPEGRSGYGDLYYYKNENGDWQEPVHLESVNTTGSELNVRIGPEGKYLFYACSYTLDSADVDILRVPLNMILETNSGSKD